MGRDVFKSCKHLRRVLELANICRNLAVATGDIYFHLKKIRRFPQDSGNYRMFGYKMPRFQVFNCTR